MASLRRCHHHQQIGFESIPPWWRAAPTNSVITSLFEQISYLANVVYGADRLVVSRSKDGPFRVRDCGPFGFRPRI